MSAESDLAKSYFDRLMHEATLKDADRDLVGRALLFEITAFWQRERSFSDVADELRFTADSLDPDTDFEFMRP